MVKFSLVVMWKAWPSHPLHLDMSHMTGWVFPSSCLAQFNVTRWKYSPCYFLFNIDDNDKRRFPSHSSVSRQWQCGESPLIVLYYLFSNDRKFLVVSFARIHSLIMDDQGNLPSLYCSYHSFFTNGPCCFFIVDNYKSYVTSHQIDQSWSSD